VTIAAQSDFVPTGDSGDTLATATAIPLPVNTSIAIPGTIGDGTNGALDVDLYQFTANRDDNIAITITSVGYSHIRVFNQSGAELTNLSTYIYANTPTTLNLTVPATGTYYVGVSGYTNTGYDPAVAGSGSGSYTGDYSMTLARLGAGDTRLSGITANAGSGTAAVSGIASANAGQTITLNGNNFLSSDQVVFTGINDNGDLLEIPVTPVVAADGNSMTVAVPAQAATGAVRLARENVGILLQVVPTLTHVDMNLNGSFNGGGGSITGSGFAEGLTTLNFGATKLIDTARDSSGMDVYSSGHTVGFTVPNGAEGGPLSVTTPGGTSAAYALTFTGITSAAGSGTAANGGQAANAGQAITINGTGLDTTTYVVFRIVDDNGNKGQVVVHPTAAASDGTSATVTVPTNAVTGVVRVVGDSTGHDVPLQIVPVIASMTVTSVAADGSSANVTLHGSGFVDGNGSSYQFGTTNIPDASGYYQGPDVASSGTVVTLTVPLSAGAYGPVTVRTEGGVSAAIHSTMTLTVANATATSGTPANAALPSAVPGQTITLTGTGLSTSSGIIFSYTPSGGGISYVLLNPATAAADGTSATLVVPTYANGVTQLALLGASNPVTLQIVPVLTSAHVDSSPNTIRLFGLGLQEGSATNSVSYNFQNGSVSDTSSGAGPDVYSINPDNSAVYLPAEPVHGFGNVSVTTAGGTSTPLAVNEMNPGDGYLRDIAMDPTTPTQVWITDNASPAKLHLVNTATGQDVKTITLTDGTGGTPNFGSTSFFGGMQIVPATMTLNGVSVPQGSILLFDGQTNPDRVIAVNPSTGAIISTLVLIRNYDLTGGIYDPFSGNIYILDRSVSPTQIVAINPANGAEIAGSRFNLPFNAGEAGLALDPAGDGTFWYGSDQSNSVVHLSATGTVIKTDDLTAQGINQNEINGLSFDNTGKLLVASRIGVVYRVTV
jgi:hypothetical protein